MDVQTLSIIATVAVCFGTGGIWLESRFRSVEKSFYKALQDHKTEDQTKFDNHGRRIQRAEIKIFGFGHDR